MAARDVKQDLSKGRGGSKYYYEGLVEIIPDVLYACSKIIRKHDRSVILQTNCPVDFDPKGKKSWILGV